MIRFQRWRAGGQAAAIGLAMLLAVPVGLARDWTRLEKDGVHDPQSSAIRIKQQPGEALVALPSDHVGNQVRWVEALEKGVINPRTNIRPETKVRIYEKDVLLDLYGSMGIVRFPHRAHTIWLDCSNCHEHLFKSVAGGNPISMLQILEGEQCGLCHGAVSFPLTECNRCHSVTRDQYAPPPRLKAVVVEGGKLPGPGVESVMIPIGSVGKPGAASAGTIVNPAPAAPAAPAVPAAPAAPAAPKKAK
jgi:c(7)-type cytochrome triheme protein